VVIPDSVTSIGNSAFEHCTGLTSVVILDSVTSIGNSAFEHCTGLTSVVIPDSVTSIGRYAFLGCTGLTKVVYCADPDQLHEITISNNSVLESAEWQYHSYVDGECQYCGAAGAPDPDAAMPTLIRYSGVCGDDLTWTLYSTGNLVISGTGAMEDYYDNSWGQKYAPWRNYGVTSVEIKDGVTSIGTEAFMYGRLTSISIPASVIRIGSEAFSSCTKLTQVIYCGNETQWADISIGSYNTALTNTTRQYHSVSAGACQYCGMSFMGTCGDDLTWNLSGEGVLTISGTGNMHDFTASTIPWAEWRFMVRSVVIEEGITSIGNMAFMSCTKLTKVVVPEGVTTIGQFAFAGCTGLTKIALPASVTNIGANTVYGCTALTDTVYCGSEDEWKAVKIGSLNDALKANVQYHDYLDGVCQYCGAIKPVSGTIDLKNATLELERLVYMNIKCEVTGFEGLDLTERMGLLIWTGDESAYSEELLVIGNENVYVSPGAKFETTRYSVQTPGLPAKTLGDERYMRVYVEMPDGSYVYSDVTYYGPQKYALDRLENSSDENLKRTLVAMLDYAAAAQIYFGYRTDDLANDIDEAYLTAYRAAFEDTMISSVVAADPSIVGQLVRNRADCPKLLPYLGLEGVVVNKYKAQFADELMSKATGAKLLIWDSETYTNLLLTGGQFAKSNASVIKDMELQDGYYVGNYGDEENVAVKELGKTIYICVLLETSDGETYNSGVVAHSAHAYLADRLANSTNADMIALSKALAVYGDAANTYFANRNA